MACNRVIVSASTAVALHGPASCTELFLAFLTLGLCGFGGVMPWARRALVDEKAWLTDREFAELLSVSQILPGANVSNLGILLGRRHFGWKGACAALTGLYAIPMLIILVLGAAYQHYGQLPLVQHMLQGVLPVSAGMIIATGLKLLSGFGYSLRVAIFTLVTFIAAAILHCPLWLMLLVLAPVSVAVAWRAIR